MTSLRTVVRWVVAIAILLHGIVHLPGAAEGLGWAEVPALRGEVSRFAGVLWSVATVLLIAAGVLLAAHRRRWWHVGLPAVVLSQAMVLTAWDDASAGTLIDLVLLAAVVHGVAAEGPWSLRTEYRRAVRALPVPVGTDDQLTEADLGNLPEPVAAYVRRSGAVGLPRVRQFRARIHGRIRAGPDKPWMPFTGDQVNTYGPDPSRLFLIDATMAGLPVDVLHVYRAGTATMRVRALSLVPMTHAAGPEMDRAEAVTVLNDLCVLAPAALVDAPVSWEVLDPARVRVTLTLPTQRVAAVLAFGPEHDLVDFVSDDRLRASPDGTHFTRQRWSTPLSGSRVVHGRRLSARGEAWWHAPEPEGRFAYLELEVDDLTCDARAASVPSSAA